MTDTNVSSGETVSGVTLGPEDTMEIDAGGTALTTTVGEGAAQYLYGGTASGTTVAGGEQDVYDGTAAATTITSGGTQDVDGGTVTGTLIEAGGMQFVYGGSVAGTTIDAGGFQDVETTATATAVNAGGVQSVDGTAYGTVVETGGEQAIYGGGTGVDTVVNSGGTVANGGTLAFDNAGTLTEAGTITGSGGVAMAGSGTLVLGGDNGYSGGTTLAGGTVELAGAGAAGTGDIGFTGPATLKIDAAALGPDGTLPNAIDGFGAGDSLDLSGVLGASGTDTATLSGNTLSVSDGTKTVNLTLDSTPAAPFFVHETGGHVVVDENPACYRVGTRIATARGAVAIETIRAGERIVVAGGGLEEATWVGHRTIDCRRHPRPAEVWPYRVEAGALGAGLPRRDLFLSPGHALALTVDGDEVLARVEALANGATIRQVPTDVVTYWHIELPRHSVIFAEGAASESYLDTGNRASFEAVDGIAAAVGAPARHGTADYCRPYVADGPKLAAARQGLSAQARALGWSLNPLGTDLSLEIDGRSFAPEVDGRWARFRVPAGARALALVSNSFVPHDTSPGRADRRRLGVMVSEIVVDGADGRRRHVAIDHPALGPGFHAVQEGGSGRYRWTDGSARIDAALGTVLDGDGHELAGPVTVFVKYAGTEARNWTRRAA